MWPSSQLWNSFIMCKDPPLFLVSSFSSVVYLLFPNCHLCIFCVSIFAYCKHLEKLPVLTVIMYCLANISVSCPPGQHCGNQYPTYVGSALLVSICVWGHVLFVFLCLAHLTLHSAVQVRQVVINNRTFSFLCNIPLCLDTTFCLPILQLMDTWFDDMF